MGNPKDTYSLIAICKIACLKMVKSKLMKSCQAPRARMKDSKEPYKLQDVTTLLGPHNSEKKYEAIKRSKEHLKIWPEYCK